MSAPTLKAADDDDEALLLEGIKQQQRRIEADKERPHKCSCGHSKQAHDSGTAFCWLCECNEWQSASTSKGCATTKEK